MIKNFLELLRNYFIDVYFKNYFKILFFIVDLIGLGIFFVSTASNLFEKNPLLAQKFGIVIFIFSFAAAHFISFKNMYEKLYLLNNSSIIIGYFRSTYDYAEILNASDELLIGIEATIKYTNSQTRESVIEPVKKFYQNPSNSVWDDGQLINFFEKHQKIYIRLPRFDLIKDNEVFVKFRCKSQRSSIEKIYKNKITVETKEPIPIILFGA